MEVIIFLSAVFLCLLYFQYRFVKCDNMTALESTKDAQKWSDKRVIAVLILGALALKCLIGKESYDNCSDLTNMQWVANTALTTGYKSVYQSGVSISLPPLLVHLMAVVGLVCKFLGFDIYDAGTLLLFKLPAILCDIAAGIVIYKIAKKKFKQRGAVLLSVAYLFNTACLLDSSMWGQTDGIYALCAILMLWFIYENKTGFAIVAFTVGVLFQPYMLILAPVLIIALVDTLVIDRKDIKKNGIQTGICLAASIIGAILVMLPMGVSTVIDNTIDCFKAYPYCSINAYNFWTALGLNWSTDTTAWFGVSVFKWGIILPVIFLVLGIVYHYVWKKRERSSYIELAILSVMVSFLFGARIHDRYLFAVMGLFLLLYCVKARVESYFLYVTFTLIQFANMVFVFYVYDATAFNANEPVPDIISKILIVTFFTFIGFAVYRIVKGEPEPVKAENLVSAKVPYTIIKSESVPKWNKFDTIVLLAIVVVYSAFAFHDIGYRYAPQTAWTYYADSETMWSSVDEYYVEGGSNEIVLDLGQVTNVASIHYYLGNYESRKFTVSYADSESGPWTEASDIEMVSVFAWGQADVNLQARYVKLTCTSVKASIFEMTILDTNGNMITPVNASDYANLFDEQDLYPERSTFRDSTYFDEIYHARTAWEYIKGFPSYENTHPPLGKLIMSIGIRIFGMNPFGWRIMGILFGIAMLPFFYLFSKRFFKETWIAGVATTMFAFDFMHFTQTRIATIDVFVTFFIIVMYYFMYKYYKMSFYDTPLKKTFVTLGLCGFTMGLAMASKWTGVYAAGGLAILFFMTIARRYREYRLAKADVEGSTNGISHEFIVKNFRQYTIKTILFCMVVFVIIPAIIYLLSYIPFRDYDDNGLIKRLLNNQTLMFTYHQGVHQDHPYSSRWWQWPIIYRPIWYFSGHVSDTVSEGISAFGNPAVWWAGIVAFFYLMRRCVVKRDRKSMFLVVGYLAEYLPWVMISRTTFIYHYFTSVPFVTMMVAYSLFTLHKEKKLSKKVIFVYTGVVVALFLLFYPVLSGQAINKEFVFKYLRWFSSWVLVS